VSEEQKKQLQTQLWNIANELRGKMNPDEFRDYILGFIFYKYLSEKITIFADDLLKADGIRYDWDIDEDAPIHDKYVEAVKVEAIDALGYFLNPKELFHYVATHGTTSGDLIENLERILNNIQNSTMGHDSEDDFESLFSELDLNSQRLGKTVAQRSDLIAKVLVHLDKIDFQLQNSAIDVLGDAYEYMIGQFASGAGKKAGEFYTPQEVSQVLARIVTDGKKRLKSVYDPTCGSGSLLLRVAKYVDEVGHFYGQELNNTTYNLARMNMILHDVSYDRFDIKQEDTLEHPQHRDMKFEAIVANPPFSANWSADPIFLQDDRFSGYGKLAPSSKADYAFIQHMIYQLDENGTLAVVMPHGVLFRGGAEGTIREYLIREKNYLDAVIGLPPNLFFGTSIPASILVFKKCRTNPESVLFIDASKHFAKGKNQNKLRTSDIDKIIDSYKERKIEAKYCRVAKLEEIAENDYNLNIPRYVDTFDEEEMVDLDAIVVGIVQIDKNSFALDEKIRQYTKELGIDSPF
jgi:type I restriction enzyme M protein